MRKQARPGQGFSVLSDLTRKVQTACHCTANISATSLAGVASRRLPRITQSETRVLFKKIKHFSCPYHQ